MKPDEFYVKIEEGEYKPVDLYRWNDEAERWDLVAGSGELGRPIGTPEHAQFATKNEEAVGYLYKNPKTIFSKDREELIAL